MPICWPSSQGKSRRRRDDLVQVAGDVTEPVIAFAARPRSSKTNAHPTKESVK
jgi:hypothetical protein